ncbi:MAG: hypothetical protein ACE5GW_08880 [Planctomycetota bacterium]
MMDSHSPLEPKPSIRDLLSQEELRELLSPFREGEGGDALLLLSDRPEEAETLSAGLMSHGVAVVPASNRFTALDLLRGRRYLALVAAIDALGPDASTYVERLREIDLELQILFLRGHRDPPPPGEGVLLERPLDEDTIAGIVDALGLAPPEEEEHGRAEPEPAAAEAIDGGDAEAAAVTAPAAGAAGEEAGVTPEEEVEKPAAAALAAADPLSVLEVLLEARVAGEDLDEALRRWARVNPGIRGRVELLAGEEEWTLRAWAPVEAERRRMVRSALDHLAGERTEAGETLSAGPFSIFPPFTPGAPSIALWHREPRQGAELARRLRPLIPLIRQLTAGKEEEGVAREGFIEHLESRMRAAERRDGRLGILLVEIPRPGDLTDTRRRLRALLRGADWVEEIGGRICAILEQAEAGVFESLGPRLEAVPGSGELRVVGLRWTPAAGGAAALLERAEGILDERPTERPLFAFPEEG